MDIPVAELPRLAQEIYAQLDADRDTIKIPEIIVNRVAAQDLIVCGVVDVLKQVGVDHSPLPLRAVGGYRILGPGRRFTPIMLRWAIADALEADTECATRLARLVRNATVASGSLQALGILADEHDRQERARYESELAELRAWSPHHKEPV